MVVSIRSTKRTASEALTDNSTGAKKQRVKKQRVKKQRVKKQRVKKQRVETINEHVSAGDGTYKDTAESLPDTLRLPIRGKVKKVDTFSGNVSGAPPSFSKDTVSGTQPFVANVTDHISKTSIPALLIAPRFPPHTNPQYGTAIPAQVYSPEYETQEMLRLWHSIWIRFKELTPDDDDPARTISTEMWSDFLSKDQSWFFFHPDFDHANAVTTLKFLASLSTRPTDRDVMNAAFTSSVWEWATVRETHLEEPDMYGEDIEDFGGKMVTAQEETLWKTIAELCKCNLLRGSS
jgi:hypothetical protein